MCFSATADLAAGAALIPVAVMSLREVRHRNELPFALLPSIFAVHQLIEAAVWTGLDGSPLTASSLHLAVTAYLFIAMPLLPTLVPLSVLLLEPADRRLRVAPFVVVGLIVSGYLAMVVFTRPVGATARPHAMEYQTAIEHPSLWVTLYIAAVIGPAVLSGYPSIICFGVVNLVGLTVVAVVYVEAVASLWCLYAAAASVLVLVHMIRRRKLRDPRPQSTLDQTPWAASAR